MLHCTARTVKASDVGAPSPKSVASLVVFAGKRWDLATLNTGLRAQQHAVAWRADGSDAACLTYMPFGSWPAARGGSEAVLEMARRNSFRSSR